MATTHTTYFHTLLAPVILYPLGTISNLIGLPTFGLIFHTTATIILLGIILKILHYIETHTGWLSTLLHLLARCLTTTITYSRNRLSTQN